MGADWQEPEPIRPSLGRFDTIRIFDALSKKFASTAYPHHGPPAARAHCEGRRKAAFAKPGEVGHCAFGARDNHEVGAGNVFGSFDESHHDAGLVFERLNIVVVRYAWQADDPNFEVVGSGWATLSPRIERHRILVRDA